MPGGDCERDPGAGGRGGPRRGRGCSGRPGCRTRGLAAPSPQGSPHPHPPQGKPHGLSVRGQLSLPAPWGTPQEPCPRCGLRAARGAAGRGPEREPPREHTHRKPWGGGGSSDSLQGPAGQRMPSPAAGVMPSSRVRPAKIWEEPKSRSRDEATGRRGRPGWKQERGALSEASPGTTGCGACHCHCRMGGAVGLRICTGARVCILNL